MMFFFSVILSKFFSGVLFSHLISRLKFFFDFYCICFIIDVKRCIYQFVYLFHNRCLVTGRSRGYFRMFGLSRHVLRDMAHYGLLPGITKSSW